MTLTLTCSSLAETERLGESLAMALRVGDLITLEGPLAAGKSALARACIRAALGDPAVEVPSPTFTLVQTYAPSSPPRIDHLDLYRLSDPQELDELGLDEALAEGAALVEWPSKGALPDPALAIAISMGAEDARKITIDGPALPRLQRSLALRAFIDNAGHAADARAHLTGDASTRRYEIVGSAKHVLMDAPPQADGDPLPGFGVPYSRIAHLAEDTLPFAAVAHALTAAGFAAPYIFAAELVQGFLLMENLGSAQIIDTDRQPIPDRYIASAQVLAALHAKTWAPQMPVPGTDHIHNVPAFDHRAMMIEVS
ncbi:MAG: tRNA (adenosine(37)-N6)-threonylcarbamoyltransferase complex ATPase subunit type 1 TsaE, partial [Pseudomonadota bacterium]